MQARGIARREALIRAAIQLLKDQTVQDISFKEIASEANVPEGSAYHFYANKYDLFGAVASQMSELFQAAQAKPIKSKDVKIWGDLTGIFVERGAEVYKKNPVTRRLLIGSTTPSEIKQIDRENNKQIAAIMASRFTEFFEMPNVLGFEQKLLYFIEITDVLFALDFREHNQITDEIVEEAKRVVTGYLGTYLPPLLPLKADVSAG